MFKIDRLIIATTLIVFLFVNTQAQKNSSIFGTWIGKLNVNSVELTMVFNIQTNEKDSVIVTFDSPDQGVKGIPVNFFQLINDSIKIRSDALQANYLGKIASDFQSIEGLWIQSGFKLPLILKHQEEAFSVKRPQEPVPPYPYTEEEVSFPSREEGVRLSGTLTIPKDGKIMTSVILVTGSGPQNRDEELMSHKPFLVLADYLTRKGIVVLRYDDRGVGKSTGEYENSTISNFTEDLNGAIDFLKKSKSTCCSKIGLIGHSEGGLISINADNNIDFLVLLGSPGLSGSKILLKQAEHIAASEGVPSENIKETLLLNKGIYSILEENAGKANICLDVENYIKSVNKSRIEDGKQNIISDPVRNAILEQVCTPWFQHYIIYDPFDDLGNIKCPVYALFGELDMQVEPLSNSQITETAFKQGKNKNYLIEVIPKANHLFQPAATGLPSEYAKIDITISPDVLIKISKWILERNPPCCTQK